MNDYKKVISKADFNKVWSESTTEDILNQFYYEHNDLRELLKENGNKEEVITQLTNNWNELEDILKIKKARMLNELDYSKYYLEGYETAIQTTHSSHSGIMLETAKKTIVVLCDELLNKMKEMKEGNNESK